VASFAEPSDQLSDPRELLVAYLDRYRDAVVHKLEGLSEEQLRRSVLPSGWTALELVHHLTFVERRWLSWGFLAEPMDDPWGDADPATGRWRVPGDFTSDEVLSRYGAVRDRSRQIVAAAEPAAVARTGGRFVSASSPPTLGWILFHLLQEYARHVGQLDVVRELIDGAVGE
jgi:uncharacterized damage-inducible protein DinB